MAMEPKQPGSFGNAVSTCRNPLEGRARPGAGGTEAAGYFAAGAGAGRGGFSFGAAGKVFAISG